VNAPRLLLDTDICIYVARHRPESVISRFQRLHAGEAVISVVTLGELQFGAALSRNPAQARAAIEEFIAAIPAVSLPEAAAEHYGVLRAQLEQRGQPIGGNDLWIAAHARAAELVLVTSNDKEFRRIPELKIQTWT
jgi:tRNA(fMet)-specific endonuclease VapC